jgi:hypothetical protein
MKRDMLLGMPVHPQASQASLRAGVNIVLTPI